MLGVQESDGAERAYGLCGAKPARAPLRQPFNNMPMPAGQLFSDWLGWLCNDWDGEGKRKRFEATMDIVSHEMSAAGVSFMFTACGIGGALLEVMNSMAIESSTF